jgi:hypothetical protein
MSIMVIVMYIVTTLCLATLVSTVVTMVRHGARDGWDALLLSLASSSFMVMLCIAFGG